MPPEFPSLLATFISHRARLVFGDGQFNLYSWTHIICTWLALFVFLALRLHSDSVRAMRGGYHPAAWQLPYRLSSTWLVYPTRCMLSPGCTNACWFVRPPAQRVPIVLARLRASPRFTWCLSNSVFSSHAYLGSFVHAYGRVDLMAFTWADRLSMGLERSFFRLYMAWCICIYIYTSSLEFLTTT